MYPEWSVLKQKQLNSILAENGEKASPLQGIIQLVCYFSSVCWSILGYNGLIKNSRNIMSKATFRIGLSGHQQLGDEATVQFVSQQLRDLLATYRQMAPR